MAPANVILLSKGLNALVRAPSRYCICITVAYIASRSIPKAFNYTVMSNKACRRVMEGRSWTEFVQDDGSELEKENSQVPVLSGQPLCFPAHHFSALYSAVPAFPLQTSYRH